MARQLSGEKIEYDFSQEEGEVISEHAPAVMILLLGARMEERRLIIYVLESALMDEPKLPKEYKLCMKDEIKNHKAAIADYKKEYLQLKKKI